MPGDRWIELVKRAVHLRPQVLDFAESVTRTETAAEKIEAARTTRTVTREVDKVAAWREGNTDLARALLVERLDGYHWQRDTHRSGACGGRVLSLVDHRIPCHAHRIQIERTATESRAGRDRTRCTFVVQQAIACKEKSPARLRTRIQGGQGVLSRRPLVPRGVDGRTEVARRLPLPVGQDARPQIVAAITTVSVRTEDECLTIATKRRPHVVLLRVEGGQRLGGEPARAQTSNDPEVGPGARSPDRKDKCVAERTEPRLVVVLHRQRREPHRRSPKHVAQGAARCSSLLPNSSTVGVETHRAPDDEGQCQPDQSSDQNRPGVDPRVASRHRVRKPSCPQAILSKKHSAIVSAGRRETFSAGLRDPSPPFVSPRTVAPRPLFQPGPACGPHVRTGYACPPAPSP